TTVTVYRTGVPANYCVSPTGSVLNDGSLGNPWLTIAKAVSNAPNGTFMQPTLINVAAGTYSENYSGQWILGLNAKSYFIIAGAGPTNTLLRRGTLTLSLPVVRIDNSGFTALRGMNLDMSSEAVAWSDNNSAIRVTTYNLVTLEDLWVTGPAGVSANRNGHGVQVTGAATTKNFVARRVLMDGFEEGAYILDGNKSTAPNTMLFDQCTFVNQNSFSDSIALWERAGTGNTGLDGVLVRNSVIANDRKGLWVDSGTGLNALGLMLISSYANVYSNVTTMYIPTAIQNLNDLNGNPLFTTLADTRPYVATGVYGKGWVTYSGNTVAPAAVGANTNVPPGGTLYIQTNAPVTFTGAKLAMAYLLLNDIVQNAGWTNTSWELEINALAGQTVSNRLAFTGSPKSAETTIIIQQIPEPVLAGVFLLGVALLRRTC
ncbi:MAG: hypothetical protein NTV22_01765, partial [bacterium]|nr:hypothetical protein [bacterium]